MPYDPDDDHTADVVADLCTGRCTTDSPELPAEHDDDCPYSVFALPQAYWPDGYTRG